MNRLIAIGDIHGCLDELIELINEKLKATREDKIIFLGDYIDRGYMIRDTVDFIMALVQDGYDIVALRGNHEVMMLDAFVTGEFALWFQNGGESTLDSFGIGTGGRLEDKYLRFFDDLLWFYQFSDYLFVHAGFSDASPFTDRHEMIWTRNERYTNPLLTSKTVIHGHTPITKDQCAENVRRGKKVINIDTGCVYRGQGYGTLTAIELNSMRLYFSPGI